ncbi:putative hydrolases or acyltransferase [Talaromyces proteolyticus]|uniref:Hydrolases or acyltransferase n=1 Tax=Talaromyces proteolyticus TaxID=1131652 RepID=A0AAD4KSA1_9EURO|nr:putative hydrolases or acyltransferase [Talaromyces proteolyticus]KAH8695417.1 putative hydrolases or acyltransferase [Talaromyces proteolyticus]
MTSKLIVLTECFIHRSSTHEYSIRWTSIGSDNSPPLIFVHGTPWSSYVWQRYVEALSLRHKIYIFDNPGFGESPGGRPLQAPTSTDDKISEFDSSLAGQAEAFAALYHSWNFTSDRLPHIVAHDNGGLITLRANLLHSCRYASLCLVDVVAVRPFGSPFFRLVAQNSSVFTSIPDTIFQGIVRAYIQDASFRPLPKHVEDTLVKPWIAGGSQGQVAFIRQMVQADQRHAEEVEGRYAEVGSAMPVKVIWGKDDRWIPVERAEKLASMVGATEVVLIGEAGHLIMFDQPERLATEISIWLMEASR